MSFRPMLRPGQGFQKFLVLREESELSAGGRPYDDGLKPHGEFFGIISEADPDMKEQFRQRGTPITHTIVQRGTKDRATDKDVLELIPHGCSPAPEKPRRFRVHGKPKDPGELGHFLIYQVEEREDLK